MTDEEIEKSSVRRLDVFVAPEPSPRLIKALVPVNRVLCLGGVPGLRALPMVGRLPGIRGLSDIRTIDFPEDDEARLRAALAPENATFVTPNHPEFFTDWMLDKEVLARSAPLAACWATNSIVNGMGALAQRFWLKNNLIAQIPGVGGGAAKAHSIAWAAKGHGVLLHPEGTVGWHGDRIGRLYPGAVEMAAAAWAARRGVSTTGRALVQPVLWKMVFIEDAMDGLHRELAHVERQLDIPSVEAPLADRLLGAHRTLLTRDAETWQLSKPADASFGDQQRQVLGRLGDRLRQALGTDIATDLSGDADPEPRMRPLVRAADRALRASEGFAKDRRPEIKGLTETIRRLLRFRPSLYPGQELTQEHLAETLKRLRGDYCTATFADRVDKMVPRPAAPRIAFIRVPEALDISAALGDGDTLSEDQLDTIVDLLRTLMQATLDGINAMAAAVPRTRGVINVFNS
ncbi:MAG: hypothetical protein R3D57_18255 [Hyphomicrobiaceae bacterium]